MAFCFRSTCGDLRSDACFVASIMLSTFVRLAHLPQCNKISRVMNIKVHGNYPRTSSSASIIHYHFYAIMDD